MASSGNFLSPSSPKRERRSPLPWVIAGAVVVVLLAVFWIVGHRQQAANQSAAAVSQSPDVYASQLAIGSLEMSEASNFAGSKVTYVDGTIANKGDKTVTGVTVAVSFGTADGEPRVETAMPLMLIRTRDPYVDIESVSAEPLVPGATHDFRLIFDTVPTDWDQKHPEIRVIRVVTH